MADPIKIAGFFSRNHRNAEQALWGRLGVRQLDNLSFERQYPFTPYIVDFYCPEKNLVIELGGCDNTPASDRGRAKFFESRGFKVMRISEDDILNDLNAVLRRISAFAADIATIYPAQDIEALQAAA